MNIRQLVSSNIASIAYKRGLLVVAFKSGSVYLYRGFPAHLYAAWFRAKSAGKFFQKWVRNNPALTFERVA